MSDSLKSKVEQTCMKRMTRPSFLRKKQFQAELMADNDCQDFADTATECGSLRFPLTQ